MAVASSLPLRRTALHVPAASLQQPDSSLHHSCHHCYCSRRPFPLAQQHRTSHGQLAWDGSTNCSPRFTMGAPQAPDSGQQGPADPEPPGTAPCPFPERCRPLLGRMHPGPRGRGSWWAKDSEQAGSLPKPHTVVLQPPSTDTLPPGPASQGPGPCPQTLMAGSRAAAPEAFSKWTRRAGLSERKPQVPSCPFR